MYMACIIQPAIVLAFLMPHATFKAAFILFLSPLYNHVPYFFDTTSFLCIVINKRISSIIQTNCLIWFLQSKHHHYTFKAFAKPTKRRSNFYQQQLDLFLLLCRTLAWMQSFLLYLSFYQKLLLWISITHAR